MLKKVAVVNNTVELTMLERREDIGAVGARTYLRGQQRLTTLKDEVNSRISIDKSGQCESKGHRPSPRLVLSDSSGLAARTAIFLRVS